MKQYTRTMDSWSFDADTLEGEEIIVYTIGPGLVYGHRLTASEAGRLVYRWHLDALPFEVRVGSKGWKPLTPADLNEHALPTVAGPYELNVTTTPGRYINDAAGRTVAQLDAAEAASVGVIDGRYGPPPADPGKSYDDDIAAALDALDALVDVADGLLLDDDATLTAARRGMKVLRG